MCHYPPRNPGSARTSAFQEAVGSDEYMNQPPSQPLSQPPLPCPEWPGYQPKALCTMLPEVIAGQPCLGWTLPSNELKVMALRPPPTLEGVVGAGGRTRGMGCWVEGFLGRGVKLGEGIRLCQGIEPGGNYQAFPNRGRRTAA